MSIFEELGADDEVITAVPTATTFTSGWLNLKSGLNRIGIHTYMYTHARPTNVV
jgi:hypothetical protein